MNKLGNLVSNHDVTLCNDLKEKMSCQSWHAVLPCNLGCILTQSFPNLAKILEALMPNNLVKNLTGRGGSISLNRDIDRLRGFYNNYPVHKCIVNWCSHFQCFNVLSSLFTVFF